MDKRTLERAWLNLGDFKYFDVNNPLIANNVEDRERPDLLLAKLMRDPAYLYSTAKFLLDIELIPMQTVVLQELWQRAFPMFLATRGFSKSFSAAVFGLLKMVLIPNTKIVYCGAAFRQSKIIFEYMNSLWKNAHVLQDICDKDSGGRTATDRCTFHINDSVAYFIPMGDGQKIRGLRANIIWADEFRSIRKDIFETVIVGFAAVSQNPVAGVKHALKREILKEDGMWSDGLEDNYQKKKNNQTIISGTCGYYFEPFAEYWKRWVDIINSKGDPKIIQEIFKGEVPDSFDWRDYSVIRIPYELVPKGFMDDKTIQKAKATIDHSIYLHEYQVCFSKDSFGFFKRTLIESCVTSDIKPVELPSGSVWFDITLRSVPGCKYIFACDPASESDNLTIFILEIHEDHRRVVYGWSTTRKQFIKQQGESGKHEKNFYAFIARKLRNLMKIFPCDGLALDSQGGGFAVLEALHDMDKLEKGEVPIWEVIDDDKPKPSDDQAGLHIVTLVNFSDSKYTAEANFGLRKDMEDKALLYPRFDNLSIELAEEFDRNHFDLGYDSMEMAIGEIEELKNELTTIVMTKTPLGTHDRWDTPEFKDEQGKKGKMRKDRYTALLMANMLARTKHRAFGDPVYENVGGFAKTISKNEGKLYNGPDWYTEKVNENFYQSVRRNT